MPKSNKTVTRKCYRSVKTNNILSFLIHNSFLFPPFLLIPGEKIARFFDKNFQFSQIASFERVRIKILHTVYFRRLQHLHYVYIYIFMLIPFAKTTIKKLKYTRRLCIYAPTIATRHANKPF